MRVKKAGRPSISKEEHLKRLALYKQGFNDREIGERCFVGTKTVWKWRKDRGYPRIHSAGGGTG